MIPRAALLAHESHCTRCGGEGFVPGVESYTSSTATEPRSIGRVPCPADCADGVVVNEQRAWPRTAATVAVDIVRLRAAADAFLERAVTAERALDVANEQIRRMVVEDRRLREAIDKAAKTIERDHLAPRSADGGAVQSQRKGVQ